MGLSWFLLFRRFLFVWACIFGGARAHAAASAEEEGGGAIQILKNESNVLDEGRLELDRLVDAGNKADCTRVDEERRAARARGARGRRVRDFEKTDCGLPLSLDPSQLARPHPNRSRSARVRVTLQSEPRATRDSPSRVRAQEMAGRGVAGRGGAGRGRSFLSLCVFNCWERDYAIALVSRNRRQVLSTDAECKVLDQGIRVWEDQTRRFSSLYTRCPGRRPLRPAPHARQVAARRRQALGRRPRKTADAVCPRSCCTALGSWTPAPTWGRQALPSRLSAVRATRSRGKRSRGRGHGRCEWEEAVGGD